MSQAGSISLRRLNQLNDEWFERVVRINHVYDSTRLAGFVGLYGDYVSQRHESDECVIYAANAEIVRGKASYLKRIEWGNSNNMIDYAQSDRFLTGLNQLMIDMVTLVRLPLLRSFDQYVNSKMNSEQQSYYTSIVMQCRELVGRLIMMIVVCVRRLKSDDEHNAIESEEEYNGSESEKESFNQPNSAVNTSVSDSIVAPTYGENSPQQPALSNRRTDVVDSVISEQKAQLGKQTREGFGDTASKAIHLVEEKKRSIRKKWITSPQRELNETNAALSSFVASPATPQMSTSRRQQDDTSVTKATNRNAEMMERELENLLSELTLSDSES
jgi:hypothetical protein